MGARNVLTLTDSAKYSRSLERGLALLRCFSGERPVLGLAEITASVGFSQTTTHRYALTLGALGYLEQDGARKYRLGPRARDLGVAALAATGVHEHSQPLLRELYARTGCTVGLGMLDGGEVVWVDRVVDWRGARAEVGSWLLPGSRLPAYCTAMGKVLLAHLSAGERRALIAEMTLSERGPNAITSKSVLARELLRVRERGVALSDRELSPELCGIAAPVRDQAGGVRAALGVVTSAPDTRIEDFAATVQPHLSSVAERLSALLAPQRVKSKPPPVRRRAPKT